MPFSFLITANICPEDKAMISSRKFDYIAILLTALVLIGVVYAMLKPPASSTLSLGTISYDDIHSVTITGDDYFSAYSEDSAAKITLNDSYITSDSKKVKISGNDALISGGGTYVISGTLNDGTISVNSPDGAEVRLILNNASITSSDFSAIYIQKSNKTVISLAPDTINTLTDGSAYNQEKQEDGKPTACLYSRDELVINGSGTLVINGNYLDALKANDELKIVEGTLSINARDEGINANDYILALDTRLEITSGGDAIKCEHDSEEKGFIALEGTTLSLKSDGDGISASSALFINETKTDIVSGGGSSNSSTYRGSFNMAADTTSTKAVKAGTDIVISGGSITLDSCDDALHSDNNLTIKGGSLSIAAGDDAVHAENSLVLSPEALDISRCYEGIEAADITINSGNIRIISNDDGINAAAPNSFGGMGRMPGGMGYEEKTSEEDIWLKVNGGHIYIETNGDGFDSNASAALNGGFLEIYGPENSGNGSIDVGDGGYALIVNGGSLLAAGSSGMAEQPTESSSQRTLIFHLDKSYSAGSSISISDNKGNEILSGTAGKSFNWVCASTETLEANEAYSLIIDGIKISSITVDGINTTSGNRTFGFGNSGRRR